MTPRTAGGRWRDERVWGAGFLVGTAVGAAATVLTRRLERTARRGLVDWPRVEALAAERLATAPGALAPEELAAAEPAYAEAMARVEPAIAAYLGTPLPGVVERTAVVDRAGWAAANVAAVRALVERLEGPLLDEVVPPGGGLLDIAMALANRELSTRQVAALLAFMGGRVLGQYDLALLSAEAAPGRLLFVEENIRATARQLDVSLPAFRLWIALHETTHAFEFEAHPWLRGYLAERLEAQVAALSGDARALGREALASLGRSLRGDPDRAAHWLERLMSPDQLRRFRETQAVMSLLEGFSDHVMDAVGRDLVPDVATISARFHERRRTRSTTERAVLRLTGLDLKMEQYVRGERFVAAIASAGGPEALRRVWSGPEALPRDGEIEMPSRWLTRVMGVAA